MFEQARTILVVTALSVIVWLFAESESVQTRDLPVPVDIESDVAGLRTLRVADGQSWTGRVQVFVKASASSMPGFDAAARQALRIAPGIPGVPDEPGEHVIELDQVLRAAPAFASHGLSINRVEPASVRVVVGRLIERQARVVVDVPQGELEGVPEATPPKVKVRLPESMEKFAADDLVVLAKVEPETLRRLIPNKPETIPGVRLTFPQNYPANADSAIIPSAADVKLQVLNRTSSTVLHSVPVHVRLSAEDEPLWDVEVQDKFVADVRVSGPAALVDQITRNEVKVFATVSLSYEELSKPVTSKEVSFGDPWSPLKFEAANRSVRLSVKRRPVR